MKFLTIILCLFTTSLFGSDYTQSIRRAAKYLHSRRTQLTPAAVVMVDFLNRNYGFKIDISTARKKVLSGADPRQQIMFRVLDPSIIAPELEIRTLRGMRAIIPSALYCDLYPLTWDYFGRVRELALNRGGYVVTQSVTAISMIEWQRCAFNAAEAEELRSVLAGKSRELAESEKVLSDLWVEAVQSLILCGKKDPAVMQYVRQLAGMQKADGSWQDNTELTAKATWVLLSVNESWDQLRRKTLLGGDIKKP